MSNFAKTFLFGLIAKYGDSLNGLTKEELNLLDSLGADKEIIEAHWAVHTSQCGRFEKERVLSYGEPKVPNDGFVFMRCYRVFEGEVMITSHEKHDEEKGFFPVGSKIIEAV